MRREEDVMADKKVSPGLSLDWWTVIAGVVLAGLVLVGLPALPF
jgi:hypothetical protein